MVISTNINHNTRQTLQHNIKGNIRKKRKKNHNITLSTFDQGEAEKLTLIQTYKKKIETELEDICSDILEIIKVKTVEKNIEKHWEKH
jgi:ATP-dependent protease HslVU (ClpYQ) peptidase subunit